MIAVEKRRQNVRPDDSRGVATRVERTDASGAGDIGNRANAIRLLADRLIAGLDDRPFRPTPDQLALIWGGDLVRGRQERRGRRRQQVDTRRSSRTT
jgi:hypothetical protein